jgi:hypothetical protein
MHCELLDQFVKVFHHGRSALIDCGGLGSWSDMGDLPVATNSPKAQAFPTTSKFLYHSIA